MFKYKEAFCLMQYRDKTTGEVEIIWNSRDGITAFGVTSREGNESLHFDFDKDILQPMYIPNVGERIWVDLTIEHAREIKTEMVEAHWEHEIKNDEGVVVCTPMCECYESKELAIEELAQHVMKCGGAPALVTVTEELQKELRSAQRDRWVLCGAMGHSRASIPNGGRFA